MVAFEKSTEVETSVSEIFAKTRQVTELLSMY